MTVKDAELFFTFLTEAGWHQNVVGYYYYKTDECPDSPDKVEKIAIFPNASIRGSVPYLTKPGTNHGYGYIDFGIDNAPIETNQQVQLLFKDEEGRLSPKFPAGYTIGYFVIANGFQCGGESGEKGTIDTKKGFIYSNAEWNVGGKSCFISLSTSDGTVVYGTEDGEDTSYDDILFCIDASPNEAIQDPDRPVIDPKEREISEREYAYYTLAYEDIWPSGGDYDLNDVVIEYRRYVTFDKDNYVHEVKETYEPIQRADAATHKNAFAVQYVGQRGTMTLPAEAVDEQQTHSVILFPDAMQARNRIFTVTRTFEAGVLKKTDLNTDVSALNPYIIVNYEGAGKGNRIEVHLPKAKATALVDSEQIGKDEDAYYVNKNGKYPFAIMIPGSFAIVAEKVAIEKEYPDFGKWVESDGKESADWYDNYQPGN